MPSTLDIFMIWQVILTAFAVTALGVTFSAAPIYCLVWASDLLGRLDCRASDNELTVTAPLTPRVTSRGGHENVCVLRFPGRRVPGWMERAVLTEERVNQLASWRKLRMRRASLRTILPCHVCFQPHGEPRTGHGRRSGL